MEANSVRTFEPPYAATTWRTEVGVAERPIEDYGPQGPHTIHNPSEIWLGVLVLANRQGTSVSAIYTELAAKLLDQPAETQNAIAQRSTRWVRPRGGAARTDGDGA
jgi:hypothetical protein